MGSEGYFETVGVDIERPRERSDDAFGSTYRRLLDLI